VALAGVDASAAARLDALDADLPKDRCHPRAITAFPYVGSRASLRPMRRRGASCVIAGPSTSRWLTGCTGAGTLGACREYFDATFKGSRPLGYVDAGVERLRCVQA